ncbi:MAG: hypothetical protein R2851_05990 [Caldilineaceae bacterium]
MTSLRAPPPSPYRAADGSLTPAAAQGREVFRRLGCNVCHGGAAWSDSDSSVVHNLGAIGTAVDRRLGAAAGIDTPPLLGLWASAPYLHDSRAPDADRGAAVIGCGDVARRRGRARRGRLQRAAGLSAATRRA